MKNKMIEGGGGYMDDIGTTGIAYSSLKKVLFFVC